MRGWDPRVSSEVKNHPVLLIQLNNETAIINNLVKEQSEH